MTEITVELFTEVKKNLQKENSKTKNRVAIMHNLSLRTIGRINDARSYTNYKRIVHNDHGGHSDWLLSRGYEEISNHQESYLNRLKKVLHVPHRKKTT